MASKPKILVVDDAGPVVILCVNVLQALGYAIRAASQGEAVLEQARRIRPDMVCMLMTAHGTPDIINEATRLGFNYILLKPFTPSELRGAVDKVLARKS